MMHVIGTAGHIDHGKSTLIRALTGSDPDRLKEEQERGMTIDLGFALLELPSGRSVGVVDVPGHHRFVKNMLAGVGGVDLVLFVVAATESWMPQSQEHLEIIDLLGIDRGIVVLTKMDQVEDEWADMVEEEVREHLAGTLLEQAPVLRVSAVTGAGMDALKETIDALLADDGASGVASPNATAPKDIGRPRLWIDRVFTVKGAGTVVTGTLQGGVIRLEDELDVVPSGRRVRVRGLQSHNRQLEEAAVGGRLAVNIAGIDVGEIERGYALCAPDTLAPSERFFASLRTVPSLKRPLDQIARLKLHVGTAERMAVVKLLDKETLGPAEDALIYVEVDRPLALQWQDRFVLRDPAHQVTVGGGLILVAPARRVRGKDHRFHRSEQSERHRVLVGAHVPERLDLNTLRARMTRDMRTWLKTQLDDEGWIERKKLASLAPAPSAELEAAVKDLVESSEAVSLPSYLISAESWSGLQERTENFVAAYHDNYPLRTGVPRETLRSHLGLSWKLFDELIEAMEERGQLITSGARVRLASHEVVFTPQQQAEADRILDSLRASPFTPPGVEEILSGLENAEAGEELLGALAERGDIVRVSKSLIFDREAFDTIRRRVVEHIEEHGTIEVGHLRDLLQTTRKYAVPLLEYMDQIEVTRRVADTRVLGLKARSGGDGAQ